MKDLINNNVISPIDVLIFITIWLIITVFFSVSLDETKPQVIFRFTFTLIINILVLFIYIAIKN